MLAATTTPRDVLPTDWPDGPDLEFVMPRAPMRREQPMATVGHCFLVMQ